MKSYVTELLQGYADMQLEIEALKFELGAITQISDSELLSSLVLPGREFSGVMGNCVSDPTANIALTYQDNLSALREDSVQEVLTRLLYLQKTVERMDFYLNRLPAHYASVLRQYYIEGFSWTEIESLTGISDKTLRIYRDKAILSLSQSYQKIRDLGVI